VSRTEGELVYNMKIGELQNGPREKNGFVLKEIFSLTSGESFAI
jgi:hypothetical protein